MWPLHLVAPPTNDPRKASLDVWIDESTSYVHRMELKFSLKTNLSSLGNTATTTSIQAAL
jgi:hypothetical protein